MITIRRGTILDHGFVLDLGRRVSMASASSLRAAVPAVVQGSYARLTDQVFTRDHAVVVAELDGVAVGFALLVHDLPDEITLTDQAFIAYMAVEPAQHRHGIGRRLLEHIEEHARRRGLPYLALMVTEENEAARELYAGAGFTTERRLLMKRL